MLVAFGTDAYQASQQGAAVSHLCLFECSVCAYLKK